MAEDMISAYLGGARKKAKSYLISANIVHPVTVIYFKFAAMLWCGVVRRNSDVQIHDGARVANA
jgi:hypothetical protein